MELNKKQDDSQVTTAGLSANYIISAGLKTLAPEIPIPSEEGIPNWSKRQHWRRFWLVDPLDETKEFLSRNGEFTVNIAS